MSAPCDCYSRGNRGALNQYATPEAESPISTLTSVVQFIKLTMQLICFFSHPSAEAVLQTNGLVEKELILRPSCRGNSCRRLPFSAKTWRNMTRNRGFSQQIFQERVSFGWLCQAMIRGIRALREGGKRMSDGSAVSWESSGERLAGRRNLRASRQKASFLVRRKTLDTG